MNDTRKDEILEIDEKNKKLNEEKQIQMNEMQKKLDEANNKVKYNIREKNNVEKKLKEEENEKRQLRKDLAKIQSYDEIDIEIDLLSQSQRFYIFIIIF